jgi:hypothetical protein
LTTIQKRNNSSKDECALSVRKVKVIKYSVNGRIAGGELGHFFQGWKSPPSAETSSKLLKGEG